MKAEITTTPAFADTRRGYTGMDTANASPSVTATKTAPRSADASTSCPSKLVEEAEPESLEIREMENGNIRKFDTGATRDTDEGKFDYEGFLSPYVLHRFAQYMHKHRQQSDGTMRDSDNWKRGIPLLQYMKSMFRHFIEVWTVFCAPHSPEFESLWRADLEEALCALLFNVMGMLHELLKAHHAPGAQ